jgi:hypothetical protein
MGKFDSLFTHPQLMTDVREVRYDFVRRVGFVYMGEHCCTDWGGATRLFEAIDPRVRLVVTIAGEKLDTCYFKTGEVRRGSKWAALAPQGGVLGYDPGQSTESEASDAIRAVRSLPEVADMAVV